MDDDRKYDALYQLTEHADHLNAICTPDPLATVTYEMMSGALIWSDETRPDTPTYVIWALREIFHHRTQLMLKNLEPENEVWPKLVSLFPDWVGFLLERRKPTPELLAEYRRGDITARWCMRNWEREDGNE
ncbi:MAG TPA: hypothetical protein VGM98_22345 [Schlesneria sp.]